MILGLIFVREDVSKSTINHEKIHIRQMLELGIIGFYLIYLIEWIYGLIKYKNKDLAYYNVSFEVEAYNEEDNLEYLKNRKLWNQWRA